MIAALSMVPVEEVVPAFECLANWKHLHKEIDPILTYFEENYIGPLNTTTRGRKKKKRSNPRYPHDLWNIYQRLLKKLPRSNNKMEAFNRGFNSQIMCKNPNFWSLLEAFRREESLQHQKLISLLSGGIAGPKRKK